MDDAMNCIIINAFESTVKAFYIMPLLLLPLASIYKVREGDLMGNDLVVVVA